MSVRITGYCAMCQEPAEQMYKTQNILMSVVELCSKKCFEDLEALRRAAAEHVKLSRQFARPSVDLTPKKEEKKQ